MKFFFRPTRGTVHWPRTFSALSHENYRLWFAGQLVSLVGSWMQTTAQGYLVYELTKSPAYLGYVGFAAGLPTWLFTLYGGVVADRISRRTLIILAQSMMMVLAFILAALVFTDRIQPWHILVMAFFLGIANSFDAPARQAFVVELVGREDMTNAIAINSMMFNAAVVVGPAAAGIAYAQLGPAWCFTLNGISYLAVIGALLLMKLTAQKRVLVNSSALVELKEGLQYTLNTGVIRWLIMNMGLLSLFGLSMMTLVPAWAVDVLHGDVSTNGMLLSSRGVGALMGALMVAWIGGRGSRGKLWTLGSFLLPLLMMVFARAEWVPVSLLIMVGIGWSFMIQANTSNALVQTQVPDHLRGRVMSIYTLVFFGTNPVGALLIGTVADKIGEPLALTINACLLLGVAVLIWLRLPQMRQLS